MDGPSKASYGYTGHGSGRSGFIRHYKALTTLATFRTFADGLLTPQNKDARRYPQCMREWARLCMFLHLRKDPKSFLHQVHTSGKGV